MRLTLIDHVSMQGTLMWVSEVMHMPSSICNRHNGFISCNLSFGYCFHVIRSYTRRLALQTKPTITKSVCCVCCVSLFSGSEDFDFDIH